MKETKEQREAIKEMEESTIVSVECVSKRWKGKYQRMTIIYKTDTGMVTSAHDDMASADGYYDHINGVPTNEWTIDALKEYFVKFHNNQ